MDIRNFFGNKNTNLIKAQETSQSDAYSVLFKPENQQDSIVRSLTGDINKNDELNNGLQAESLVNGGSAEASIDNRIPEMIKKYITWPLNGKVPYSALTSTFENIETTTSRLEKESIFCNIFRSIILSSPNELEAVVYLASNQLFPAYEGLELGIGDALLIKAVTEATGRNKNSVKAAYDKDGDLGTVASQSRMSQSTLGFSNTKLKCLTATEVLDQLRVITKTTGGKSMDKKVGIIKQMMVRCQNSEAKYLVRALQGKLRIGTAFQTVLVALAHAFSLSPTSSVLKKMSEMGGREISTLTNQLQDEEQERHINNDEVHKSEDVEVADRGDGKKTNLRPREGKKVDATVIRNRIVMGDEDDLKGEGCLPPEVTDGDASAKGESLTAGDVLKYFNSW